MKYDLKSIAEQFEIPGAYLAAETYGAGHINDTFLLRYECATTTTAYIIQCINHTIFTDPAALMQNIERVCAHLKLKYAAQSDASRRFLDFQICKTSGTYLCHDKATDSFWRAYRFVENAHTFDILETPAQAFQAARAFGCFQRDLADMPGERLNDIIPDFHHTPKRFEQLERAVEADSCDRLALVQEELAFAMARKHICSRLLDLHAAGQLPERITHNDCKLNNVLIDDVSAEGICVIDLDTVMPGFVLYDFGDMVRTGTSPAAEDERDLSKVEMRMEMFEALAKGYLEGTAGFLSEIERGLLPFSAKLITLTIGLRFLTDFLNGDCYFKTQRPNHNLDRCRAQFRLLESIEEQESAMMAFVDSV